MNAQTVLQQHCHTINNKTLSKNIQISFVKYIKCKHSLCSGIAAFYKTFLNSLAMPNKGKNKEKHGHIFIDKMNSDTKCIPFINSKEPFACNCCSNIDIPVHIVQSFFYELIRTY